MKYAYKNSPMNACLFHIIFCTTYHKHNATKNRAHKIDFYDLLT